MSEKLKPCPFCGSEAKLFEVCGLYIVKCKNPRCGIKHEAFRKGEVISMWNTRAEDKS